MKTYFSIDYIKNNNKPGFILLFTIVVISITVGLTVTLLSFSKRSTSLNSARNESQAAVYNADQGIECALLKYYSEPTPLSNTLKCGGRSITASVTDANIQVYNIVATPGGVTLSGKAENNKYGCGVVVFRQNIVWCTPDVANCPQRITDPSPGPGITIRSGDQIESYGYNSCIPNGSELTPDRSNPTLVERKLLVRVLNYFYANSGNKASGNSTMPPALKPLPGP